MLAHERGDWLARMLPSYHYDAFSIFVIVAVIVVIFISYFDNVDTITTLAFANILNIDAPFGLPVAQLPQVFCKLGVTVGVS